MGIRKRIILFKMTMFSVILSCITWTKVIDALFITRMLNSWLVEIDLILTTFILINLYHCLFF